MLATSQWRRYLEFTKKCRLLGLKHHRYDVTPMGTTILRVPICEYRNTPILFYGSRLAPWETHPNLFCKPYSYSQPILVPNPILYVKSYIGSSRVNSV